MWTPRGFFTSQCMPQCLEHRRCSAYVQRTINLARDINYYSDARKRFLSTGVYFQDYFLTHKRSYTIMMDVNKWVCYRCWQHLSLLPINHHLVNKSFFSPLLLHCGQVTVTLEINAGCFCHLMGIFPLTVLSSAHALQPRRPYSAAGGKQWQG